MQENLLVFSIIFGILILSLGVYMVGNHIPFGSTIQIFNRHPEITKETLNFRIEPFYGSRALQIYLNDKLVFEDIIKNETWVKKQLNLTPGLNVIKFYSVEGCDTPTELGLKGCDLRCLSFKIGNI